jgi:hypothetical protein
MSRMNWGSHLLRVTWQGSKQDMLFIHPETAQRMRTTALENGARLEAVQRIVGYAAPSATQLYDQRRFMPIMLAALVVDYMEAQLDTNGPRKRLIVSLQE